MFQTTCILSRGVIWWNEYPLVYLQIRLFDYLSSCAKSKSNSNFYKIILGKLLVQKIWTLCLNNQILLRYI